jgi:DNA-binding CsgD family transcriptional regulator
MTNVICVSKARGRPRSTRPFGLTKAEIRVLIHAAAGYTTEQTARILVVDPETVKTHRAAAADRLGARGTTNAVALALIYGVFSEIDRQSIAELATTRLRSKAA